MEKAKCKNCTDEMIEEMARKICPNSKEWTCKACNWGSKPNCDAYKNAEKLINEGYRKIPEGSVVLSKEEYEGLQMAKDFNYGYHEGEKNMTSYYENIKLPEARKETAEKIWKFVAVNGFNEIEKYLKEEFGIKTRNNSV